MKKKLYAMALCIVFSVALFAGGGDTDPPTGRFLVSDRIRNTIAIDPDVTGAGVRFYVATFGLEAFDPGNSDHVSMAPRPIPGSLVRFGIQNVTDGVWTFQEVVIDSMNTEPFNIPGSIPINCYTQADRDSLDAWYGTSLTFTDGTEGTEGYMRQESGTGFWASPVFYKDNGSKHLIVLNKSGCLMSINVDEETPIVLWKVDLRGRERSYDPSSYKYEFMATPVLHNDFIYVAGIKMVHIVDLSSGAIISSLPCLDGLSEDYFETPLVFDAEDPGGETFYLVSRSGRAFKYNGVSVEAYDNDLGLSQSPPLLDADGHVYFVTKRGNQTKLSFVEQNNRAEETFSDNMTVVDLTHEDGVSNIKSSILTDFTKYKYMFTDNYVLWETGNYDFSTFSISNDPIRFYDTEPTWNRSARLTEGCTRFPGNHSILSYQNTTNKTLIYSISNRGSNGYEDDVSNYYPNTEAEYDLSNSVRGIRVSMACFDHSYTTPEVRISSPRPSYHSTQTWGGVSPYKSTVMGWLNVVYGDEAGYIWSHPTCVNSGSVGFNVSIEDLEPGTVPEMGYTKYMKNISNVPTNNEIDSTDIYLFGPDAPAQWFVFANSYVRSLQQDSLSVAGSTIPVWKATFENLLPNKQYLITWKDSDGEIKHRENVTIPPKDDEVIVISVDPDLVVENSVEDSDIPDVQTDWPHSFALQYNTVTVEDNAYWRVGDGSRLFVDQLILGDRSRVTIGDGALLQVNQVICSSSSDYACINMDGGRLGKLQVYGTVTNMEASKLRLEGYNNNEPSYYICTALNKSNASMLFQSCVVDPADRVSTTIDDLYNFGTFIVNDCVKLSCGYVDQIGGVQIGTLKIGTENNFGHLVWQIQQSDVNTYSPITSGFEVGHEDMTDPNRAIFTVSNNAECIFSRRGFTQTPYKVHGKMVIGDASKCTVELAAVLQFMKGSELSLEGNLDPNTNGAELFATTGGVVRIEPGVSIVGRKPNPAPKDTTRYGDRIIIGAEGRIEGVDPENPRRLKNLSISTSHQDDLRWEGIHIESEYIEDTIFELVSDDGSVISGIDKIYVENPGNSPNYQGIVFDNCTHGVYSTTDTTLVSPRVTSVQNCTFRNCTHGTYIEDKSLNGNQPNLEALIAGCQFGGVDAQAGNINGIALHRAVDVKVNNCSFQRNGYGIFSLNSSVLVGGNYNEDGEPELAASNLFYDNEKAGIHISQSANNDHKSLIIGNDFSGTPISNTYPGLGIWADESSVDIIDNTFSNLGGHGMLANTYSWYSNQNYHGFSGNSFQNNMGCELIGDAASLSTSAHGQNTFNDAYFRETGFFPRDPLDHFDSWDKYILANLSGDTAAARVMGNNFVQPPLQYRDRFYPDFYAFIFDTPPPASLTEIIVTGMNQFYQGSFDEASLSMKQAVETYPNEELTKLAIDYLYLITRASSEDYASLRTYLDQNIPADSLVTHIKKEEIKTKCYIQEEEYLTAISRLQQVIDNPETVADSLFALISQAYCAMNLAESGAKLPLNVSAKTRDFASYLELLAELMSSSPSQFASSPTIPEVLTIESNYPNPFNPETTIAFSLPHDGKVKATVYNIKGQKVKRLLDEHLVAGKHTVIWNGTDSCGRSVASGVYFVKIKAGKQQRAHKMVLLK